MTICHQEKKKQAQPSENIQTQEKQHRTTKRLLKILCVSLFIFPQSGKKKGIPIFHIKYNALN